MNNMHININQEKTFITFILKLDPKFSTPSNGKGHKV